MLCDLILNKLNFPKASLKKEMCGAKNEDEGYIDMEMEVRPQCREFEFQMTSSVPREGHCPADDLFYKGKLLPLHLPPRLQMLQNLLHTSSFEDSRSEDDYLFEWSAESNTNSKKSWAKKLKQFKQISIGQKLKASRHSLKSLFNKSACSHEAACNGEEQSVLRIRDCLNKYMKAGKRNPFTFGKFDKQVVDDAVHVHRKSFSGVIQRHSPTSSSGSSSFSFSSNSLCDLKRSSSASSEIENSIEEAIAHCKQSHHLN